MKTLKGKIDRLGRETVLKAMLRVQQQLKRDLKPAPPTDGDIDPEVLQIATRLVSRYIKAGVHNFSVIIEDLYFKNGEVLSDMFQALKSAYAAYFINEATEEEADQMDANVRGYSYQEMMSKLKEKAQDEDV